MIVIQCTFPKGMVGKQGKFFDVLTNTLRFRKFVKRKNDVQFTPPARQTKAPNEIWISIPKGVPPGLSEDAVLSALVSAANEWLGEYHPRFTAVAA